MSKTVRNYPCLCANGREIIFLPGNLPRNFRIRAEAGFTYLGLLILLMIIGIVSTVSVKVGVVIHRRAAEETLLEVGKEFSLALESYRRVTPAGLPDEPQTLQDLLRDPRFPGVVRHLRKLYYDPITGQQEWGLLRSEDTQLIVGVFSLSNAKPIKRANFDMRFQDFNDKTSYQEWVFSGQQTDTTENPYAGGKLINPRDLMDSEGASTTSNSSTETPSLVPGWTSPLDLLE